MSKVLLVTGVGTHLGARFASLVAGDPAVSHVLGLDSKPPPVDLGRAEFLQADIRTSEIGEILGRSAVDTVVHLGVLPLPADAGGHGRGPQKEINVIGTMQLLAACQKSATVRSLVLRSTTDVYGASPRDPAVFSEDMAPKTMPRSGYAKDSIDVEGYVQGFARRRPDVAVTILRLADVIGPSIRTAFTEYLGLPAVPVVFGHDARLQFLHEDDALGVLRLATVEHRPGTYNVAGDGVLMLSQAVSRAGRPLVPLPAPAVPLLRGLFDQAGGADLAAERVRFLTYGRAVDTTRMRRDLRFEPRYSTEEAFDTFLTARFRGPVDA